MLSQLPSMLLTARKKKKTTDLQLESLAPGPVMIFLPGQPDTKLCANIIPIKVSFVSSHSAVLPKLRRISRNLVIQTTAHAVPFRASSSGSVCQSRHGVYKCDMSFPNLNLSSVRWEASSCATFDSVSAAEPVCNSSNAMHEGKGSACEAILQVPFPLPLDVRLAPSFDSCLISRSYTLEIGVSYRDTGRKQRSSVSLKTQLKLV